jgi:DNA (cytosine-5)-methyltransferase 1
MNVIDLFAGCGGLSKGFMDAGFDVLLGVDNNEQALRTFAYNHKSAKTFNGDLSKKDTISVIKKMMNNKPVDLIIAGPPCQGFSLTGPRNFDDERNKLYLAVFDMVKAFEPEAFVIENVNGMATLYGGQIKDEIIRRFEKLGYTVNSQVLCAADFGVPQMRKRLIFVGLKPKYGTFCFPEPIVDKEHYVTCREAIDDLPSLELELGEEVSKYTLPPRTPYQQKMRGKCEILHNHVATNHTEHVKDVISQVPEGGNYRDLPDGVGTSRNFHEAWTRYDGNKTSRTIDTGHRNHFHYQYNRVPTIRENARLQSFPDDFVFLGNKTQQNRQVGNAVPPLLGYYLGLSIKKTIESINDGKN